ncbi:copper amine oxidase domain protein [Desulfofarcimen acetoxidans DSM 771]|uniref:Copper amine oxidase domain protein n=1 Tax=Desulfofarcimen acetoxidans (strain ATCC 49208 / DSM 771 / KCTC 5769 / VKM B-1644 / 5575) TaxID=485916 RepID=C8W2T7_DESAS|nr:stalk domain-containing protein [Desulfofarcimen acetoxidans]ACV61093.1 copper amine oxidase domain protein [Desulfofarcimen acetoxidans DSM 771]
MTIDTTFNKFIGTLILFLSFAVISFNTAYASGKFTVGSNSYTIDQQVNYMDVSPYIKDNRTYLPVRFAAIAAGVSNDNIMWNDEAQTVVIVKGNQVVQFSVGNKVMLINGVKKHMDVSPEVMEGRVMIPLRFLAEALGADVNWDASTQTITISGMMQHLQQSTNSTYLPVSIEVPAIQNELPANTVSKDFEWKYNDITYTWHVVVPTELLDWDRKINNIVDGFYSSNAYEQAATLKSMEKNIKDLILSTSLESNNNLTPWVNEPKNYKWAGYHANSLSAIAQSNSYDYFHTAEFVQSFVGAIPYNITDKPQLPAQTIVDNGDCKDKSILLASMLKNMGYQVALLIFYPTSEEAGGHMAVGIVFNDDQIPTDRELTYYLYDGIKYYFAETTTPNWLIGQISDEAKEKQAYVYPVN